MTQHAHNPVDWYPWGAEALGRARAEDRPIFLSIGYSSCHWCHVMEAEVFEHDDVAEYLNAHFVSIKVDREERPDLDETYMRSLLAMTGSGGWPMSLFLTPGLSPFFGATYLPRDRFLAAAAKAVQQFAVARAEVESGAAQVRQRIEREAVSAGSDGAAPIGADELHALATSALARFDARWGGFRGGTKFPTPVRWSFLLHAARKWDDPVLTDAVRTTLEAMASGGIRDPIGGGFHRYSTDVRWETPHFEKMLYDNAQLASLYLEAGLALREPRYLAVATDTLDFLLREMQAPEGGFYASLDADSEGREGAYYVWTRDELVQIGGPGDGDTIARLLGIGVKGTFDGGSVPNRRAAPGDVATATGRPVAEVEARWAALRPELLATRSRRPHPRVDTKVVTAWNGLVLTALSRAFEATGDSRYRDAAVRAADWLWRVHFRGAGGLVRDSNAGLAGDAGVLADYAFLTQGMIALFEATHRVNLLERAITLVAQTDERFGAGARGGWYDSEQGATPFGRSASIDDSVEPSGSAALLADRVALGALTLRDEMTRAVDVALRSRANDLRASGVDSAGWLDAALLRAGPCYEVVLAGDDAVAVNRLDAVRRGLAASWIASAAVPAAGPDEAFERLVVASHGKTAPGGSARAYVCLEGACKAPTSEPLALRALLLGGWRW